MRHGHDPQSYGSIDKQEHAQFGTPWPLQRLKPGKVEDQQDWPEEEDVPAVEGTCRVSSKRVW